MDIFWWLESIGRLARTIDDVRDPSAARREPSMQLIGHRPGERPREVDLPTLQSAGVRLLGRFYGMDGSRALFRSDLAGTAVAADLRMHRLLDAVDEHITCTGLTSEVPAGVRPSSLVAPAQSVDVPMAGIGTVLVATGYRPEYPWLRLPIVGPDGYIQQDRGITAAPGVYVVGQRFQHRRDSGFIDGARHDAHTVVQHLLTACTVESAR